MKTLLTLTGLLVLTACDHTPNKDVRDALKYQKAQWIAMGVHSYSYVYGEECFCVGPRAVRVVVENDVLKSVTDPDSGAPVVYEPATAHFTVPQLYDYLITSATRASEIGVQFDPTVHMPSMAWIDFIKLAIDDEITVLTHSFQAK